MDKECYLISKGTFVYKITNYKFVRMENIENQEVVSKKSALMKRMQEKYPDMNPEDEESIYGNILGEYGEYDGKLDSYKKNEEELINRFNENPRAASFLLNMKEGKDPIVLLVQEYGDEITDIINDPEKFEEFQQAREEYQKKILSSKKLNEEAEMNGIEMMNNLDAAQEEGGYSDEQITAAFEQFNQILNDALVHKVSKDTWLMVLKGLNHDEDVNSAAHEAEIKGRNAKINAIKKKTSDEGMPPVLGGQSNAKSGREKQFEGALGRAGAMDIFERGGYKKTK